ncbi:hypothetical protein ACP2AV_04370 [Aliiroseovarius sp. PTFE2010]|uniref:hypothetical protein n=1 Tax=Aliiroseovarius sp. PTFE2010 TaxID=3417190 RepID=UPI003CEFAA13
MSDPMSMPEIEDVVSSIRRLVSETGATNDVAPEARKEPEKFVLTPALRVQDNEDAVSRKQAGGDFAPEETAPNETASDLASDLEDVLALHNPVSAAESDRADDPVEWVDDRADDPSDDQSSEIVDAEIIDSEGTEEAPSRHSSLEERIAELEAAIGAQAGEFEPDGSEESAGAPHTATILSLSRTASGTRFDGRHEPVTRKSAEVLAQDSPQFDDDFAHLDDDLFGADDPLEMEGDDAVLDEDALKDLVAQIVREELQGDLGERITRNVRRLVRREVQRALTLRELD